MIMTQDSTTSEVGPGHYFDSSKDQKRLWRTNSINIIADNSSHLSLDRSHHYRAGVLLNSGLMISGHRSSNVDIPGPGHYKPSYSGVEFAGRGKEIYVYHKQ